MGDDSIEQGGEAWAAMLKLVRDEGRGEPERHGLQSAMAYLVNAGLGCGGLVSDGACLYFTYNAPPDASGAWRLTDDCETFAAFRNAEAEPHYSTHALSVSGIRRDSQEASRRVRAQWDLPRHGQGERQVLRGNDRPVDCFRCRGRLSDCPLHEEDWRMCPHAM